jgi:hypothetical protein
MIGLNLIQTTDPGRITWSIDGGAEQTLDLWAGWLGKGGLVRSFLLAGRDCRPAAIESADFGVNRRCASVRERYLLGIVSGTGASR